MTRTVISGTRRGMRAGVPPGTRLNGIYEVERQIATGGMGEIYRGRVIGTGDLVAIKMIKPEFAEDEAIMSLFRKEASALNRLNHDNIVRYYVFSLDETIGRAYLAMEFVEGIQLTDRLSDAPLSFENTLDLARHIAAGLQAAHDKGIIHRDISSDNIIVPNEDLSRCKIIDFGIARSTMLGAATVIGEGFAGKYNYVSPEQLGMYGGEVTVRSDIYSLGLVLAECLRGRPIDMGGSIAEVTEKRRTIPDLSGIDRRIHPLLRRMLAPRPEDRPASMNEVIDRLAVPASLIGYLGVYTSIAMTSLRRVSPSILGAGLTLMLGGTGYYLTQSFPPFSGNGANITSPARVPPSQDITATQRAERIEAYIRYHDAESCLYLSPVAVSENTAHIEAFSHNLEAIASFRSDFQIVNGFFPNIITHKISEKHCDAIAFLQQLDARRIPEIAIRLTRRPIKAGDTMNVSIQGAGTRTTTLLLIEPDGGIINLTPHLQKDGTDLVFSGNPGERTPAGPRLLIALVTDKTNPLTASPLTEGAGIKEGEFLSRLASDLQEHGAEIIVSPLIIEPS
jgi:serine/threonine protein kinase